MASRPLLPLGRVPDALWRDVRGTLAVVFTTPARLRRLAVLGPHGWVATARFLTRIIPRASRELAEIRERAAAIPDAELRAQALASVDGKAYHVQGGCILATFLDGPPRETYVRSVAALETIYDYLDNLCDRIPGVDEHARETLHEALLDALDERRPLHDYYAAGPGGDDGGYLRGLVETVRAGIRTLPSYAAVRERVLEIARYYAALQTLKHGASGEREAACDAWYGREHARFPGLAWWEFAAACGSSMPVFALLALAARPAVSARDVDDIADAYFPGLSAVHILLDYFIDQAEDRAHGELNFVACYASESEAVVRLRELVSATLARIEALPDAPRHRFVLEAMCVFYLTHPKIYEQRLERESDAVLAALTRHPAAT